MSWLATGAYRGVLQRVPVLCVDGIIMAGQGKYLLVKRKNEPLRGRWWVPGGRVLKGEKLAQAFRRKMRDELGLRLREVTPVGYFEMRYRSRTWGGIVHAVSVVFSAKPVDLSVTLDDQSSDWGLFSHLPKLFRAHTFWGP